MIINRGGNGCGPFGSKVIASASYDFQTETPP